jgi:hypothetical protein
MAALAFLVGAIVSNEGSAPERIVAGTTVAPASSTGEPVRAAVTRDGLTVRAALPNNRYAPGEKFAVDITVENGSAEARAHDMEVCIVETLPGTGWTSYSPSDCSSWRFSAAAGATAATTVKLRAPDEAGEHGVFLRWGDAPSGDFLPLPFRVAGNVSAETLSTRIELATKTVEQGAEIAGELVVENDTGAPVDLWQGARCTPKWAIVLTRPGEKPDHAFTMECVGQPLRIDVGTTRLPFTVNATYQFCTNDQPSADTPKCEPGGGQPPLPVGTYDAAFATPLPIDGLAPPEPVSVSVVENVSAETLSATLELDRDVVRTGEEITGDLVIRNNSGRTVELSEGGRRCAPAWGVIATTSTTAASSVFWTGCAEPMRIAPGTTRLPFTAHLAPESGTPGDYRVRFVSREPIAGLQAPADQRVTVTP